MHTTSLLVAFLALTPLALSQIVGNCHPYPGAAAQDCLQLIGDKLGDEGELDVSCASGGRATITLQQCSITTVNKNCAIGSSTSISTDDVVRRTLTAIGACALNDRGSISGDYIGEDGLKTCYLFPGQEGGC